jgi:hypothetical protein
VYGVQRFAGLQFDDDRSFDDQIDAVLSDALPFVSDIHQHLPLVSQPAQVQLVADGLFVEVLRKARPQLFVHFNKRANEGLRQSIS